MVNDPFEGALARVERAERHRHAIGELWRQHIESKPRDLIVDPQTEGEYLIRVTPSDPVMPIGISVVFSEWLHNLKSALDNTLYEAAVIESGQEPPPGASALQFPIATTADAFARQANRFRCLSDESQADLEHVQPYNAQPDHLSNFLYWINELGRLDRHRRRHLFASRVVKVRLKVDGAVAVATPDYFLDKEGDTYIDDDEGLVVARLEMTPPLAEGEADVRIKRWIDAELEIPDWRGNASTLMRSVTLDERMSRTEDFIRHVVEHFGAESRGRRRSQNRVPGGS